MVIRRLNGSFRTSSSLFPCFFSMFHLLCNAFHEYEAKAVFEVSSSYCKMLKLHLGKVKSFRDSIPLPK